MRIEVGYAGGNKIVCQFDGKELTSIEGASPEEMEILRGNARVAANAEMAGCWVLRRLVMTPKAETVRCPEAVFEAARRSAADVWRGAVVTESGVQWTSLDLNAGGP